MIDRTMYFEFIRKHFECAKQIHLKLSHTTRLSINILIVIVITGKARSILNYVMFPTIFAIVLRVVFRRVVRADFVRLDT